MKTYSPMTYNLRQRAEGAPVLVVPVGLPGCGKTTFYTAHLATYLRISADDVRMQRYNYEETGIAYKEEDEPEVRKIIQGMFKAAVLMKQDIYLDATHLTRQKRAEFIPFAKAAGYHVAAVEFNIPLSVALMRNIGRERKVDPHVVCAMQRDMESPHPGEGFDQILLEGGDN